MGATLTLPAVSIPRDDGIVTNMVSFLPEGYEYTMLFSLRAVPDAIMTQIHRKEELPAGMVAKGPHLEFQGFPAQAWMKTHQQKTLGEGCGQQDAPRGRRSSYKDDTGTPAGRKGGGKSKTDIIERYVEEHGVQRCEGQCEICSSQPKRCCHWENHRYPPDDWLTCDCMIREIRLVRLEDDDETLMILEPDSRVEVISVGVTPACHSMAVYAGLSEPTMIMGACVRDATGAIGWMVAHMQTETYDKWYIEPTGRNASMDFGHVHQCITCYNLHHRSHRITERDLPPGRPPRDRPAGTRRSSVKRARTEATGPRSEPAGGDPRHQLSQF